MMRSRTSNKVKEQTAKTVHVAVTVSLGYNEVGRDSQRVIIVYVGTEKGEKGAAHPPSACQLNEEERIRGCDS